MSDTKKTVEQVEKPAPKVDVIANLKKWVNGKLAEIKKSILSTEQIENIAVRVLQEARPAECRVFLVNIRYELPAMGGLPLMPGTCLYKFLTFTLTEEGPGLGIPEELAKAKAIELGAEDRGLTVESLSTDFIPTPDQEDTEAEA